ARRQIERHLDVGIEHKLRVQRQSEYIVQLDGKVGDLHVRGQQNLLGFEKVCPALHARHFKKTAVFNLLGAFVQILATRSDLQLGCLFLQLTRQDTIEEFMHAANYV